MTNSIDSNDLENLKALAALLKTSFPGAMFGDVEIDDCLASLQKVIAELES